MLAVYLASGLSFIFTVLRDYGATLYLADPRTFFDLIYVSAISSGMTINALSVGIVTRPNARLVLFLGICSCGVQVVVTHVIAPDDPAFLPIGLAVTTLYIYGAFLARILANRGLYFLSRSRDGIANVIISVALAVGVGPLALPLGLLLSTVLMVAIVDRSRPCRPIGVEDTNGQHDWRRLCWEIFFVNSAPLYMNVWALGMNQLNDNVLGVTAIVFARLVMYAFQFACLFTFVLRNIKLPGDYTRAANRVQLAAMLFSPLALMVPPPIGLLVGPATGFALLASTIFTLCAENNALHSKLGKSAP